MNTRNSLIEAIGEDLRRGVYTFMEAASQSTQSYNAKQLGLYIGLQLEELAEKLEVIQGSTSIFVKSLNQQSADFKSGKWIATLNSLTHQQKTLLLDADVDLAWVTFGSMYSMGATTEDAISHVIDANIGKLQDDGTMKKDSNGKVMKPEGWTPPDLTLCFTDEVLEEAIEKGELNEEDIDY